MRLHARAPAGTRIEETEVSFANIEHEIRSVIPADEMDTIIDNIGIPNSWSNLAQGDCPTICVRRWRNPDFAEAGSHVPREIIRSMLRKRLHERFPDMAFFFQAANITNQILNFGLPAPIDLQVVGRDADANYKIAEKLAEQIARIPGAADVHVHQVVDSPGIAH